MSDTLREKRVELVLQQLQQLPTLPSVAVRVLEVTGSDSASAKQVVDLISSDQSLTAKILQMVHRSDTGIRGDVNSVERAVVLLGFDAVRSAVLALSVFGALDTKNKPATEHFHREEFWKHSVAVACCAESLAQVLAGQPKGDRDAIEPAEAFVAGLLHDLGKVALDAVLPKSFDRVVEAADLLRGNIADLERTIIGLDHMVVGKRLAERWQLPAALRDCIWLHGQHPAALPESVRNPRLVNLVTLADLLVREQHIGYSGNHLLTPPRALLEEAVGISESMTRQVQQRLVEQIEPRAKALGLGQSSSNELYQSALEQANRELGRMSEQLAAKNRRLAIRAKFFDALAQFQGELRPDAAPQVVMQAIGQTAIAVLHAAPVAVFSTLPGQEFCEIILLEESGETMATSVIDCPPRLSRPLAGEGPVLSTGDELEWLLESISPRLAGDMRYWICFEAEGHCIGGVVWGARAGEAQRLSPQAAELTALAGGWSLALRTAQIREESRTLSEQLAEANRQLHNAQNQLLRSRTLVTVGEMAAGAAHEMNNPLAVISGRAQLLASQLTDPKHKAAASAIAENAHRLSQIITDLMAFAKPVPPKPAPAALGELIEGAIQQAKALNQMGRRRIEVRLDEIPPVLVDGQQIQSAVVEVLDNAIQATDENEGLVLVHAAHDAYSSRVALSISDNGCGMDERTAKQAFDPFFSSKPAGRRRGMGLAKALRWIESSGGTIRLESSEGHGTTVLILLPAVQPEARPADAQRRAAGGQSAG